MDEEILIWVWTPELGRARPWSKILVDQNDFATFDEMIKDGISPWENLTFSEESLAEALTRLDEMSPNGWVSKNIYFFATFLPGQVEV